MYSGACRIGFMFDYICTRTDMILAYTECALLHINKHVGYVL